MPHVPIKPQLCVGAMKLKLVWPLCQEFFAFSLQLFRRRQRAFSSRQNENSIRCAARIHIFQFRRINYLLCALIWARKLISNSLNIIKIINFMNFINFENFNKNSVQFWSENDYFRIISDKMIRKWSFSDTWISHWIL